MGKRTAVVAVAAMIFGLWSPVGPAGAGDANDDGLDDLAIGIPGQTVSGKAGAGAFMVLPSGGTSGSQVLTSDVTSVPGSAEASDRLGTTLAWGDFNGDGFSDLAAGAPQEDVGQVADAGNVTVFKGSSTGLTTTGSADWNEGTAGVAGSVESGDQFGSALATGDINGDTYDDLVISSHLEDVGSLVDAGSIIVLFGSPTGLVATGSVQLTQNSTGVPSTAVADEKWSYLGVASGDVNNDGFDDIAVSDSYETVGGKALAGAVILLRGSAGGVSTANALLLTEDTTDVAGTTAVENYWSYTSVAFGDFNDDGFDDLVVGAIEEWVGTIEDAGAVTIVPGSATGLTGTGSKQLNSNSTGVAGTAEAEDKVGRGSAGVGDFNGDGYDDLAVSIAYQMVSGQAQAGAVLVLNGSASGITATGSMEINEGSTGVAGSPEAQDYLGFEGLAGRHLRVGAYDDLVITMPRENVGSLPDAGAVLILRGSATGLTGTGSIQLYEDGTGVLGTSGANERFGNAAT